MAAYTYIPDAHTLDAVPADGILSRTLYSDEHIKVIFFGFAPGEELSEHTASLPATLHFLSGRARLILGGDEHPAGPGTWVHMPARLPHSVYAEEPTVMLLTLLKQDEA